MGKCLFMRKGETHSAPKVGLPSGYTELSYIQSSGTQYIDTGFKPNQDTSVVMDFAVTSVSTTSWLFCGRTAANNSAFGLYAYSSSGKFYAVYGTKQYTFSTAANLARQQCDFDKNTVDVAGETYVFEEQSFESSATLYLLARNTGGTIAGQASAKLYTCQIYDNGTLVRDFVPCVDPDGNIGLYDTVNKKFYGNMGTGYFSGMDLDGNEITVSIKASDLAVGSSVYLNDNGKTVEYLVVNQGIPSNSNLYDSSCDGMWLLRKYIPNTGRWDTSTNEYAKSDIHTWLNSTFFNSLGSIEQSVIKQVKIPYGIGGATSTVNSGSKGLSAKVFLLSHYELGWSKSYISDAPVDGAKLNYFATGTGTSANNLRIASYGGTNTDWWTRSCDTDDSYIVKYVNNTGSHSGANVTINASKGIRPALILPSNALFDANTLVLKGVA